MEVVEGLDDAGHEELGGVVVEAASVSHDGPQLTTQAHFHEHVDELAILVCLVQPEGGSGGWET